MGKLLSPTNDYVFKRLFGHKGNEDITEKLLQRILKRECKVISLNDNKILEKDLLEDKVGIIDVRAKLEGNTDVDIEMQVCKQADILQRLIWYWSKMFSSSVKSGEPYISVHNVICILIADFDIEEFKGDLECHTELGIMRKSDKKEFLTNIFGLHIIELRKMDQMNEDISLKSWLEFIKNPTYSEENMDKEITKAKEELDKISQDEREEYMAHLRDKHIRDSKSIYITGYTEGVEIGEKKGEKIGIKLEKVDTLKRLIKMNMPEEDIIKILDITLEELKNLKTMLK